MYRGRLLRKNYADIRRKQKVLKFRHSKALHCFMWETSGRVTFVRRWWECNDVEWPSLFEKRRTELKSLGSNSGSVFVSFLGKDPILFRTFQWDSGEEATGNLTGFWGEPRLTSIIEGESINFCNDTSKSVVCGFNLQCNCSNALSNACLS